MEWRKKSERRWSGRGEWNEVRVKNGRNGRLFTCCREMGNMRVRSSCEFRRNTLTTYYTLTCTYVWCLIFVGGSFCDSVFGWVERWELCMGWHMKWKYYSRLSLPASVVHTSQSFVKYYFLHLSKHLSFLLNRILCRYFSSIYAEAVWSWFRIRLGDREGKMIMRIGQSCLKRRDTHKNVQRWYFIYFWCHT